MRSVSVIHTGCEVRIRRVVEQSSADTVEPFQTKMTHFVAKGKLKHIFNKNIKLQILVVDNNIYSNFLG